MLKLAAVVIPVYKKHPSDYEKAAFQQALEVLGAHDIFIFTHRELDLNEYRQYLNRGNVRVKYFRKWFFESLYGYSQLLTRAEFYRQFKEYEFMLIYHLDAWVFRDELSYWCSLGYDFTGSPLLYEDNGELHFGKGLNGGFCLKKVSSHLKVLQSFKLLRPWKEVTWTRFEGKTGFKKILRIPLALLDFLVRGNSHSMLSKVVHHEDNFWTYKVPGKFSDFKVAPAEESLRFSFEQYPAHLYQLNKETLPFGCHGWERYESGFWKDHIPALTK